MFGTCLTLVGSSSAADRGGVPQAALWRPRHPCQPGGKVRPLRSPAAIRPALPLSPGGTSGSLLIKQINMIILFLLMDIAIRLHPATNTARRYSITPDTAPLLGTPRLIFIYTLQLGYIDPDTQE